MNRKKRIILFIGTILILYYLNFLGRLHGLYLNFIITGITNFVFTYFLLKINPFKKMGLFLIFFPFILLTITVIYGVTNSMHMPGIIGYLMYSISTFFAVLIFNSKKKILLSVLYFGILIVSIKNYNNMLNHYFYSIDKNVNVGKQLPNILISDKYGNTKKLKSNGKILVIDLWSNTCGNCIKAFPKFEKLKNDFIKDEEVDFIAINIYSKKTDIIESENYLKNYSFTNFYSDVSLFDKLNFNTVPNYLVIGKDGKIKYFGNLNMETFETYNNMYKLIENEK